MDDFADRTINELIESHSLFVDALKDEYEILVNMINIIFSSCSIITKTNQIFRSDAKCLILSLNIKYIK